MSLKHALLGFLNYGPMTGYELKKFFDTSVNHFWSAELSQIYPTLKQLSSEGLVKMKVDVQEDRPNRKVHSITDDGRRELINWLGRPTEPEQVREPLMIKVFFGAALPKEELLKVLRQQVEQMRWQIEFHKHGSFFIQKFGEAIGLQRDAFFWGLTVDAGVKHYQAGLQWAEEAIQKLEQMEDSDLPAEPRAAGHMDVRKATDILERLKATMPQAFASVKHTNDKPKPD